MSQPDVLLLVQESLQNSGKKELLPSQLNCYCIILFNCIFVEQVNHAILLLERCKSEKYYSKQYTSRVSFGLVFSVMTHVVPLFLLIVEIPSEVSFYIRSQEVIKLEADSVACLTPDCFVSHV